jgi:hypothetical protein
MILKVCHISQLVLLLFFLDVLLKMFGKHAKIEETNMVSASNKLFSLDVNGQTLVLVSMLVLMIVTMLSLH